MTTRREFIKLAAGTLAIISLPMGLLADEKKEIVKVNIDIILYVGIMPHK